MRCTCCGADVPEYSTVCYTCGASITPTPKPSAAPDIQGGGEQVASKSKVCSICGAPLADGATFCYTCGATQTTVTSEQRGTTQSVGNAASSLKRCEKCGAELPPGSTVCFSCGATQTAVTRLTRDKTRLEKEIQELEKEAKRIKNPTFLKIICMAIIALAALPIGGFMLFIPIGGILSEISYELYEVAFTFFMIMIFLIPIPYMVLSFIMYPMSGSCFAKAFINLVTCGIFSLVNAITILVRCKKVSPKNISALKSRLAEVNKKIAEEQI